MSLICMKVKKKEKNEAHIRNTRLSKCTRVESVVEGEMRGKDIKINILDNKVMTIKRDISAIVILIVCAYFCVQC